MLKKVLCLHGSEQTAEIFRTKTGNLTRKCRGVCTLEFIDAPHLLPMRAGNEVQLATWYCRVDGKIDLSSFEASLQFLETKWASGEYDGVFGFSMGGALGAVMASLPQRFPGLMFLLAAGSPDIGEMVTLFSLNAIPSHVRSVHVMGRADTAVPMERSILLAERFHTPITVEHSKGHLVPTKASILDFYIRFISCNESDVLRFDDPEFVCRFPTAIVLPIIDSKEQFLCASEAAAIAQREEVEALQAIYPQNVHEVSYPLPESAGDETVCFLLSAPEQGASADGRFASQIQRLYKELRVKFIGTSLYPDEAPIFEIIVGDLSLVDFTSSMRRSFREHIVKAIDENPGTVCAFAVVQSMIEWIESGPSVWSESREHAPGAVAFDDEDVSESINFEELGIVNEDEERQFIEDASREAFEAAAGVRKRGENVLKAVGLASDSARGVWNYVVGLVGKPSAGKSTFYNAVTRAVMERDGRRMAEMAPHPFTTIEPNVGPGWYAAPPEESRGFSRDSLHGRDSLGRRLLPIVVKDVAGLVPGAYKGRGKGNRFLADLCDADVLVHVVDATGKSDTDGNIIGLDGLGSSPSNDAKWVREELHRWIHSNITAKLTMVGRKGTDRAMERLHALFSGYQGTRLMIEEAVARSGLDISKTLSWSRRDTHKLVAHYLSVRFPICLALNKIDLLGPDGPDIIKRCQLEAEARGELAIPVSARTEVFLQVRQVVGNSNDGNFVTQHISRELFCNDEFEAVATAVLGRWGSTGVLEVISAAVSLNPPVLCFPVSDLDSEFPVGCSSSNSTEETPRLRDCVQLKPGSTVYDIYEALKKGTLGHVRVLGDFVRAEGTSLTCAKSFQLGRDVIIGPNNCVIKVQTNRKSVWQQEHQLLHNSHQFCKTKDVISDDTEIAKEEEGE